MKEERRHFRGRAAAAGASLAAVTELMLLPLPPLLVADAAFGDLPCSCSEAEEAVTAAEFPQPGTAVAVCVCVCLCGGEHNLLINVPTSTLADKHPGCVPPPSY